jgi:hypothetical protein
MTKSKQNKPTQKEMKRLLELSSDPEFISQLASFKEEKAQHLRAEYQDKISALETEIKGLIDELNGKLTALGVTTAKAKNRRRTKTGGRTRRTKEATQKLSKQVKGLVKKNPGITAGDISKQINESASPFLSRLKSEGIIKPRGKGRGTVWHLAK